MSTNPKIFIKRLIEKLNDKDLIIEQQKSFIQQQDKMLDILLTRKAREDDCPSETTAFDCESMTEIKESFIETCKDCWRKYLQSEVGK